MRERRSKCVSVQNLRNTRFRFIKLLLITPITGSQRELQSVGNNIRLESHFHTDRLARFNPLLHVPSEILDDFVELRSEYDCHQWPCKVKSFFAQMVSIVGFCTTEGAF